MTRIIAIAFAACLAVGLVGNIVTNRNVNPCPNGTHWDALTGSCVPNE
jgi:hypothetical protein